ncbi:MAG: hypothetical protein KAQ90_08720 [Melioribacteraceae bacterium]|nr:hypothetical protein [Melioribacteraceae bacterium]
MGNQQLLLIVLGVIIVAIAVVIGFNLFTVSFAEQVTDMAILKVNDIGVRANVYKIKSTELGGGGGSYIDFDKQISSLLKEDEIVKKMKLKEHNDHVHIDLDLEMKGENGKEFKVKSKYEMAGLIELRVYDPDTEKWTWLYKK